MKITVLYDNEALEGFRKGWGFSCLIEHDGKKILFDTGWDGRKLLYNMKKAGVKKEDLDIIVLSHDHWDHIGGLTRVLHSEVHVYLPMAFSRRLKREISEQAILHEVDGPEDIMDGVYLTGELGDRTKEMALVVRTEEGLMVITGCSHPGLDVILRSAGQFGKLKGVMGGFHGFDNIEDLEGLSLILPCHCTERKKEILERFPSKAGKCAAGMDLRL